MDFKKILRCISNAVITGTIFHKIGNYLLNYWEIKNNKTKLLSRPITSVFSTASVCNYRCKFCQINSMLSKEIKNFPNVIPLESFKKLKFFGKSTVGVCFFGNIGEPLANKNFGEIAKILKKNGIYLDMTTNASLLTPEFSDQLIKIGFDHLLISFHAGTKKTYEYLQNKTFDLVVRNIKYFTKNKNNYSKIFLNFALNKINAEEIPDFIQLAKKLKLDGILLNHYYHSNNGFPEDISFYDNPKEGNKFIDQIYNLGRKNGVKVIPDRKPYLMEKQQRLKLGKKSSKCLCKKPFQELNFYSNFEVEKTFDVCVCNKFFLFQLNWEEFGDQNMDLIWNHPVVQYLRKTKGKNAICEFCQNKETPYLRNLNSIEYRDKKTKAINEFLSQATETLSKKQTVRGLYVMRKNNYGDFF